ncbi:hypothetical protein [Streptomyces sp900129855]|uniref:Uncharacterized protein n=1 Tax=Streptomyces sp. 900129855 TaxID=3155129 RepID=A0ABV2ZJ85_9ACTN
MNARCTYAGGRFGQTTRLRSTLENRVAGSATNRRAGGVQAAWT